MIELHRLQNQKIYVNVDLIEFIESTPDTLISMTTGKKLLVRESVDEVIEKVVLFKREVLELKKEDSRGARKRRGSGV